MGEIKIGKNFLKSEFLKSETADKLGIVNDFDSLEEFENLVNLVNSILQPARDFFMEPIVITSGYRNNELNKSVGGVNNSQHTLGEAVDISFKNKANNKDLFNYIRLNHTFDQLIWEFGNKAYPDWVHVSLKRNNNRNKVLKASKVKGRTVYISI